MNEDNEQNLTPDNGRIQPPPGLRKLFYKGKNAGKKVIKGAGSTLRMGFRNIWQAMTIKGKIIFIMIVIFVILCACAVVALSNYSVDISNNNINSYISSLPNSSPSSQFYNRTGSLLLMKYDDIKAIASEYLDEIEISNYNLYLLMQKEYGSNSENIKVEVNLDEKRSLYEHFLSTEKYNFNRIKWVKYNRSKEDGVPRMQIDTVTRLKWPHDNDNTSLQTLVDMFQPYMQNYIIPYSLYVGLITDGRIKTDEAEESEEKQLKFGYEMINSAYHAIQVNQYNMESYTKITKQNVYDILDVNVTHSITIKDGAVEKSSEKKTTINTASSCVSDELEVIEEMEGKSVIYKLKDAKVFDKYIINEYKYTEYDLAKEPNDQVISREVYKDDNYKLYEAETYVIPDSEYNFRYDEDENIKDGTYTAHYTFQVKKGYTDTVTSTWKDILEQVSHEERAYKVQDIQDGLKEGKLSSSEKEYYKLYEYNTEEDDLIERLNTFDIANSKKEIYKNYLRDGDKYSENIGYPRSWMTFSFYTLKQAVKEITENNSGWKYFYGSSIGAEEATSIGNGSSEVGTALQPTQYSGVITGEWVWPVPERKTITSYYRI